MSIFSFSSSFFQCDFFSHYLDGVLWNNSAGTKILVWRLGDFTIRSGNTCVNRTLNSSRKAIDNLVINVNSLDFHGPNYFPCSLMISLFVVFKSARCCLICPFWLAINMCWRSINCNALTRCFATMSLTPIFETLSTLTLLTSWTLHKHNKERIVSCASFSTSGNLKRSEYDVMSECTMYKTC